jgi:heme-degrading monooxygenase HmoA
MVLEVGLIDVVPGSEQAFVAGFAAARPHLAGAPGCRSVRMTQGVESPGRFVLLVEWDSVAAHEGFRASEAFAGWRAPLSPHFAGPPRVEHFSDVPGM